MRVYAEAEVEQRDADELHVKAYFQAGFQVIWRVLISLNRVFSANVLATWLLKDD